MMVKTLDFDSSLFDAVICLDANLPNHHFFNWATNVDIIAADGAATKLLDMEVRCDFVIGDIDSFRNDSRFDDFDKNKIIKILDQDTNDFEKILRFCLKNDKRNILVVGMHGGELEHTLNNQSVFNRYASMMNLCIYDVGRYGIPIFNSIRFACQKDEIISIIPQPYTKITTKNLEWELCESELYFGKNEGARNRSTSDFVEILLHEGFFMLFIDSRAPKCPIFL